MSRELCPKCKMIRDMVISTSHRQKIDAEGKVHHIRTTNHHCAACGVFVRSVDSEEPPPGEQPPAEGVG